MDETPSPDRPIESLTRDTFTRRLIAAMATEVEAVVGHEDTRDIVGLVGLDMGEEIEKIVAPEVLKSPAGDWSPRELGEVLVELKRRIHGDFFVESVDASRVVLGNRRCPFGEQVLGRPSLCMMTSSVFGGIAARHFGFARVDVEESFAKGDAGCRVVVHLEPTDEPGGNLSETYHGPDDLSN